MRRPSEAGTARVFIAKSELPGWYRLVVPWIPDKTSDFVDELKSTVSPAQRRWNSEVKEWLFHEAYLDDVVRLVTRYFGRENVLFKKE